MNQVSLTCSLVLSSWVSAYIFLPPVWLYLALWVLLGQCKTVLYVVYRSTVSRPSGSACAPSAALLVERLYRKRDTEMMLYHRLFLFDLSNSQWMNPLVSSETGERNLCLNTDEKLNKSFNE